MKVIADILNAISKESIVHLRNVLGCSYTKLSYMNKQNQVCLELIGFYGISVMAIQTAV